MADIKIVNVPFFKEAFVEDEQYLELLPKPTLFSDTLITFSSSLIYSTHNIINVKKGFPMAWDLSNYPRFADKQIRPFHSYIFINGETEILARDSAREFNTPSV